ncbi:MAG: hypothetical protein QM714_00260 [Nocardioides sp.]
MLRLRNTQSGAVVSCSEETAARLGPGWEPVEEPKAAAKKAAPRKPKK